MNNTNDLLPPPCKGDYCDFVIDTTIDESLCQSGGGSCMACDLLEAEPSGFHDAPLIEATTRIKQIISEIPEDASGRKLSFFITQMGILMAWSSHDKPAPANGVTAKDGREAVAQALKLKI